MSKITPVQFELLKGFFAYMWNVHEEQRLRRILPEDEKPKPRNTREKFAFWAQQLDKAGISWSIQNNIACLAEVRENGFFYLRNVFAKANIEVVG